MQQENKPTKKKLLSKFDEVLGSLLPSEIKEEQLKEESQVEIKEEQKKVEPVQIYKAYGLIYHKDTKKYEMINIEYDLDTKTGKVTGSEMQRDNFIKALDRVREMYVKDIHYPQLPRNK